MNDFNLVKKDIEDIMVCKSQKREEVLIYAKNMTFFEELLNNGSIFFYKHNYELHFMDLTKITQEDMLLLENCLDYINMIKD